MTRSDYIISWSSPAGRGVPIPIAGYIPGTTASVDEAIEVLLSVYHGYLRCYIP